MNQDLFINTHVINLNDSDFEFGDTIKLTNKSFKNKDGYIMVYANWCPNCQNKVPFWSLMAEEFNTNPNFAKENFKIGVISTTDPHTKKIVDELNVQYIPKFVHVTPGVDGNGTLSEFSGDHNPESLLSHVCQNKAKLCDVKYVTGKNKLIK